MDGKTQVFQYVFMYSLIHHSLWVPSISIWGPMLSNKKKLTLDILNLLKEIYIY